MRGYQYRSFRAEMERQILKMVNKGWDTQQIQSWLLARVISCGSVSVTGAQLGELLDMVPGHEQFAAG